MHAIRIDRGKPLAEEPHVGHNRYHPDIPPISEVGEGEEIALETRDALDGQIRPGMTGADLASINPGVVHPLTGPVAVKGAAPGDVLEIEFTDIIAQPTAFSAIVPGLGFLRDVFAEPFLVHWRLRDGWATSEEIPGVRIPGAPFMGVSAVAPSAAKLAEWTAREQRVIDKGGFAFPPDPAGAVPAGPCGLTGLRTLPPRENGGNFDVKQLSFCRSIRRALCSRPATDISRKAMARYASPRSRWAPPPSCASRSTKGSPGGGSSRHRYLRVSRISLLRVLRRRSASLP